MYDTHRVLVDGQEIPPYDDAVAYVQRTGYDAYGIQYADGHIDWLGTEDVAFGDDDVTVHPDEDVTRLDGGRVI